MRLASTVVLSIRGGVPVLSRPSGKPSVARLAESPIAGASPKRPSALTSSPRNVLPPRNVPVASTTARASSVPPSASRTPRISSPSATSPSTIAGTIVRFACPERRSRAARAYAGLSACARNARTAAPLLSLSQRACTEVASINSPISPPSASISRTSCPFALPPTLGLQGSVQIFDGSPVTSSVSTPRRAEARAASSPACPPPPTITPLRSCPAICGLYRIDDGLWFGRTDRKTRPAAQHDLHGVEAGHVPDPSVPGQMNSPTFQNVRLDRTNRHDLAQRHAAADARHAEKPHDVALGDAHRQG